MMFADDIIFISENARTFTKFLQNIQKEGALYGLKLNMSKCELIRIARMQSTTEADEVTFADGTKVKISTHAKYLGCWLNDRGDPNQEVRQRIATCMKILKKTRCLLATREPFTKAKTGGI